MKDADLLETEQYCSRVTRENSDDENGIVYDTKDDYEEINT